MNDKVKEILQKVKTFWDKYNSKQKTIIISITAVTVIALIILGYALTRPTYKELITCEDTTAAADIKSALVDGGFNYKITNNGLTFSVEESQLNDATYLIAQGGYTASGYTSTSINDALGGGFSTTSEDKERLYQKYLEDKMKSVLEELDYVSNASVTFMSPPKSLSVLAKNEETSVAVKLKLKGNLSLADKKEKAQSIAKYVAMAVGNETTNNIYIIDTQCNTLFDGSESTLLDGTTASERENIKLMYENDIVRNVTKLVAGTNLFHEVAVAPALKIDWEKVQVTETMFSNPDEVKYNDYIYEATGVTGSGGIPGTDSNDDDTTYEIITGNGTTSTVTINKNEYAVSSTITHRDGVRGNLILDDSTVGVVLTQYIIHEEDYLRESGALDNISWSEYQKANSGSTQIEVDESIVQFIASATNIPIANLSVVAYQVPMFNSSIEETKDLRDYIPVILAVAILGMLALVVWRSLKPVEISDVDAGLSVDELLTATQEAQRQVDDIDFNEKSDVRKAIEKFVDENPESVALLLRNWLNEEWE